MHQNAALCGNGLNPVFTEDLFLYLSFWRGHMVYKIWNFKKIRNYLVSCMTACLQELFRSNMLPSPQLFLPKALTTFLTCFCRCERRKYAEKKFSATGDLTHNHQVMSPTRSQLSHPGGACRQVKTRANF